MAACVTGREAQDAGALLAYETQDAKESVLRRMRAARLLV